MLSIVLKEGEYFMLGDDIRVVFVKDLAAKSARIAIDAPRSVVISRGSLYEKSLRENPDENAAQIHELDKFKRFREEKRREDEREKKERQRLHKQRNKPQAAAVVENQAIPPQAVTITVD